MCELKYPYDGKDLPSLCKSIRNDSFSQVSNRSKEIQYLITVMLNKNASKRPSAKQLVKLPFIMERAKNLMGRKSVMDAFD